MYNLTVYDDDMIEICSPYFDTEEEAIDFYLKHYDGYEYSVQFEK